VTDGADEIDLVIPWKAIWSAVGDEQPVRGHDSRRSVLRHQAPVTFKTILETWPELKDPALDHPASEYLALEEGATHQDLDRPSRRQTPRCKAARIICLKRSKRSGRKSGL